MDTNIALFFQIYNLNQKNPVLDALMIFGADYLLFIVLVLILFLAILGKSKERKAFILSILGLLIALILVKTMRIFIHEDRPFITFKFTPLISPNYWFYFLNFGFGGTGPESFPSVHTLTISVITFSYLYFKSKLAPFLIFSLIWICFARIFVGVHYPLDIVGGILVGALSVFLVSKLLSKILDPTILRKSE